MKWILLTINLVIASNVIIAQQYIELIIGGSNTLYIEATVAPGYTLYGLSSASGSTVDEIIKVNKKGTKELSINELLILPLQTAKISNTQAGLEKPMRLYYTTKPGDNLYRISKSIGTSSDELMHLNAKADPSLALEEKLLIGWVNWPYQKREDIQTREQGTQANMPSLAQSISRKASIFINSIPTINSLYSVASIKHGGIEEYVANIPEMSKGYTPATVVKEKGIAFWQKAAYESKELIVMHRHAKVNSKISLYNPMLKRKVDAKVVSELPNESYSDDISVVISPSVATALGALDRRFLVEITYVE